MPRFSLNQALTVLMTVDNDLADDDDDPHFISVRGTGCTLGGVQTATITLIPCDDMLASETFNVTITRAAD